MVRQRDIMKLEYEIIKSSYFQYLTPEEWVEKYAKKYRDIVSEMIKETGSLPEKNTVILKLIK